MKDLPGTVPERRRIETTIAGQGAPSVGPPSATDADAALPHSVACAPQASSRELIVPSQTSVATILDEVRKAPAERLEIEARLGSGGMGSIETAVDRALDRRIALKTLHPHLSGSESAVRMFLREARLTALLDHPHVVPLYDIGQRAADQLYFAMKLVEGQTLGARIRALPRGPLDTATLFALLDVIAKVCDALAFAHSRGVLHCDVKPSNIMVGDFGQVYLMDWGIARLVTASDGSGAAPGPPSAASSAVVMGSPLYMSPEQARGQRSKIDCRSDVFLLGATLYEVLTRRAPFEAADRQESLNLAAACTFPAPRRVAGEGAVPPELERIVLRAMAEAPDDRYPSVAEFREDLVRFMRGGAEFPRAAFTPGEAIVTEGEPGDSAYIIVAGKCEVRKDLPSGSEVIQTIGPGDVFGEMAILARGPRTATVVAIEDTLVLVVTSKQLEEEMAALKPWMATLLRSLAARFRDADTRQRATVTPTPSPVRLANQVLMYAVTWGTLDGKSLSVAWSELTRELEAQLGASPVGLLAVAARYGMHVDHDSNRLTIADARALRDRLRRELATARS